MLDRRLLFAALYFSEGAPIGFLWWHLPTELRLREVPVEQIAGLTAVLALPWAFKFLWAPLVDALRGPRFGLRGWIVAAQTMMAATLVPLLFLDLRADFELVFGLLVAHAVCAATQDVAIDALAIRTTAPEQRGVINGWMQTGMLSGRVLFSGGTLLLGAALGLQAVIACLIVVVLTSMAVLWTSGIEPPPPTDTRHASARLLGSVRTLVAALGHRAIWLGIAVALVGGAGFEAVGALAGPWLVDLGRAQASVGAFWTLAALGSIPGALFGGWLAGRIGPARAATRALAVLTATIGGVTALGATGIASVAVEVVLVVVFVALGAFTASTYTLFMNLAAARPAARATVFSAFMGLTNLCESWAAKLGGELAGEPDGSYAVAFAVPAAIALVAVPPLLALRRAPA